MVSGVRSQFFIAIKKLYCLTFIADTVGKYGTEEKRIGRKGKKKLLS